MKKTKILFLASFALLLGVSVAMLFNSCKKSDDDTKGGDLIGKWYNETPVGVDDVVITTLEFTDDNMLNVTICDSDGEDDLNFTLLYEIIESNVVRIVYDYKDKGDDDYFEYFDERFEIKGNYSLTFVDDETDDANGTFYRINI